MFDAFFVPPDLRSADVERMRSFGITEALVPLSSTRAVAHDSAQGDRAHSASIAQAQALTTLLQGAGIHAWFADAISPNEEPERLWEHRWEELCERVDAGELAAIGELRVLEGSARALRVLDRHLALAADREVPILVSWPGHLDVVWRRALLARARDFAPYWWWTRVPASRLARLTSDGAGAIATIGGKGHSAPALVEAIAPLPTDRRVALGSGRGRGLNPFALASVEIAAATHVQAPDLSPALEGRSLRQALLDTRRPSDARATTRPVAGVAAV